MEEKVSSAKCHALVLSSGVFWLGETSVSAVSAVFATFRDDRVVDPRVSPCRSCLPAAFFKAKLIAPFFDLGESDKA